MGGDSEMSLGPGRRLNPCWPKAGAALVPEARSSVQHSHTPSVGPGPRPCDGLEALQPFPPVSESPFLPVHMYLLGCFLNRS